MNAEKYNDRKKTSYRLPKDLVFTYSLAEKNLDIREVGLPKDRTYSVNMHGYDSLDAENIRWYA